MINDKNRASLFGYGALFFVLMFLAGNGFGLAEASNDLSDGMAFGAGRGWSAVPAFATPPGGTIPVISTGISVLHLAPLGTDTEVTTVMTSTTGAVVSSTGITVGERWAGSPFADSTRYLTFPAGDTEIAVVPVGSTTPILVQMVPLTDRAESTLVLTGGANGWVVDTMLLEDSISPPPPHFGKVRIVHVAPLDNSSSNTALDVVEQSGAMIDPAFNELMYREVSGYITLPAGEYDWRSIVLNTADVIELAPFKLNSGAILSIYILGDGNQVQPAGLMVINEFGDVVQDVYLPLISE